MSRVSSLTLVVSCADAASRVFVACRYVDLETLGEEERGNKLPDGGGRLEYAVHGKFARSETDKYGLHDAFWVPLTVLAEQFERDDLEAKLVAYKARLSQRHARAVYAMASEVEEEEQEEEEEAGGAGVGETVTGT